MQHPLCSFVVVVVFQPIRQCGEHILQFNYKSCSCIYVFMPEFVVLLPTQFCCKNDVGYNIVSNVRHGIVLKGNETEDASWSENLENVHISPACFFW